MGIADMVWMPKRLMNVVGALAVACTVRVFLSALGFNGRGVAAATVTGKLIAELVCGTPPAELPFPVTAPNKFALHRLRKLGVFAMSQYYRILDGLEARS